MLTFTTYGLAKNALKYVEDVIELEESVGAKGVAKQ